MSDIEDFGGTDFDGENVVERKAHKRLLAGVNSLQKIQLIKKPTRDETASKRSEFHLIKSSDDQTRAKDKVNVHDLLGILDKSSSQLNISKKLKKTTAKKKILPKPLEKPAADKLQRAINYEKAKDNLMRWDAIVAKQKTSDHLCFPLHQDVNDLQFKDNGQVPSQFRIKSEMMREMEVIEPQLFQSDEKKEMVEEQPKLTRAEMIARSRELRALRMKESQRSAKAHLQNKIKSKKYHRILKKEKMRQQIKEFELLQKTDPEAALRKIEQLDNSRIEERANLRHKNTGTWAKNLQIRAKYDKDVRKELADQLAISRELTAKKEIDESDEDEGNLDTNGNENDPFNPWLTNNNKTGEQTEIDEFLGDYRKYWQQRNDNEIKLKNHQNENDDEQNLPNDSNDSNENQSNGFTVEKINFKSQPIKRQPKRNSSGWIVEDIVDDEKPVTKKQKKIANKQSIKPTTNKKNLIKSMDNIDDMFDEAEEELKDKFTNKLEKLENFHKQNKVQRKNQSNGNQSDKIDDSFMDLGFKQKNLKAKIDEELIMENDDNDTINKTDLKSNIETLLKSKQIDATKKISDDIDNINPDDFAKVRTQHLKTALPSTIYSEEGDFAELIDENIEYHFDDEKKLDIAQAFEDDDIVAEFQRDKDTENKKNQAEEIDLSLPGWGSWGGVGIKKSKKSSKNRLIFKTPVAEKRKIENHGNVIIIENRDEKLQKHLVSNLPFPFTSVADYEQSIRAPIGRDFVPATAHRLLTKPSMITKTGAIIEPMTEKLLVKKSTAPRNKTAKIIARMNDDEL